MPTCRTALVAALALAAHATVARAQAPRQPRPADGPAPDGYEDCVQGGSPGLTVAPADAATGRGLPWRVLPYVRIEWRAGQSAGGAAHMPNFGPGGDYPTAGTADDVGIGVTWGRPGTYRLRVLAPGYQPWDTAGVRVPQAPPGATPFPPYAAAHCAIGPEVVVVARLRPAPRGVR